LLSGEPVRRRHKTDLKVNTEGRQGTQGSIKAGEEIEGVESEG
jgi:hypothetical protein